MEFRVQEGKENRDKRLRHLWLSLPKKQKFNHGESEDEEAAKEYPVENDKTLTQESARRSMSS